MSIEEIKKTYDLPGRQWERHMYGAHMRRNSLKPQGCSFERALEEALKMREQIDANDKRVQRVSV